MTPMGNVLCFAKRCYQQRGAAGKRLLGSSVRLSVSAPAKKKEHLWPFPSHHTSSPAVPAQRRSMEASEALSSTDVGTAATADSLATGKKTKQPLKSP